MSNDLVTRLARIIEPGYDKASHNTRRNAEITARAVLEEQGIVVEAFRLLSYAARCNALLELRGSFCLECGSDDPRCRCWDDE